jgi:hypothetical protein
MDFTFSAAVYLMFETRKKKYFLVSKMEMNVLLFFSFFLRHNTPQR